MAGVRLAPGEQHWLGAMELLDPEADIARVRLHVGGIPGWYLKLVGNSAITFGNHVWFVSETSKTDIALMAHELVHVAQYRRMGRLRFLTRYGLDLLRAGFRYSKTLPLEAPAYARQDVAKRILREAGPPSANVRV